MREQNGDDPVDEKRTGSHRSEIEEDSGENSDDKGDPVENRLGGRMIWGYVEHIRIRSGAGGHIDCQSRQTADKINRKCF